MTEINFDDQEYNYSGVREIEDVIGKNIIGYNIPMGVIAIAFFGVAVFIVLNSLFTRNGDF